MIILHSPTAHKEKQNEISLFQISIIIILTIIREFSLKKIFLQMNLKMQLFMHNTGALLSDNIK